MKYLLLPLLTVVLGGCIPYRFVDRPGVSGSVIDGRTKRPIAGATVTGHFKHGVVSTKSSAKGTFKISPKCSWGILFVPMDPYGENTEIDFTKAGYIPAQRELTWNVGGRSEHAVGPVLMDRRR